MITKLKIFKNQKKIKNSLKNKIKKIKKNKKNHKKQNF